MTRHIVVGLCFILVAAAVAAVTVPDAHAAEPSDRPNIVVFYIDDIGPHDGRLWNNPAITPNLYKYFVERGTEFTDAIVEDPLCCPARGNFLTGLHTHNNGLVANDARQFDPSVHVGRSLKKSGYATMFIGKYLNNNWRLTTDQWKQHDSGWTYLDVFKGVNGYFYDYVLHTREGNTPRISNYHSTQMIGDRTRSHIAQTAADKPVFAVLSIYNLHGPNTPMPQFKGSSKCAGIGSWDPPNYNEADVSDKPAMIQAMPLQPYANGWPMQKYCEEMLGVDKVVGEVVDELKLRGRLENTLLVFTGDNGIGWGQHRMGQSKRMPYTTPVPLLMSWPARWGTEPRTITTHTSNIDLAPTFCEIAGCTIGPFTTGQAGPDGMSILPVLDNPSSALGRDALLEAQLDPAGSGAGASGGVTWTALRTTRESPLGLWHYVEYSTGERELYSVAPDADPWELENVAEDSRFADIRAALEVRLAELRMEGRAGTAVGRPDASIALTETGTFKIPHAYFSFPSKKQRQRRTDVLRGVTYDYFVRVGNDAIAMDSIAIRGDTDGTSRMKVAYWHGTSDVSAAVEAGTYIVDLDPGETTVLTVRIKVGNRASLGSTKRATVTVRSVADPSTVDVVRAVAKR